LSELNVDKSETAPAPSGSNNIEWDDFMRVDLRVGTIISVEEFPEARRPAYKLQVDFGDEIGIKKSSAQITELYDRVSLLGRQVLAVVNFPPKQIGPFMSECLVTGFNDANGAVVLTTPTAEVPNGSRLI
jgi:tRNA-binding protein|tara:strand:+ start:646 stop:1035 length:390 start_codon:yes stop_codon:yes gene_type:complete